MEIPVVQYVLGIPYKDLICK